MGGPFNLMYRGPLLPYFCDSQIGTFPFIQLPHCNRVLENVNELLMAANLKFLI